MPVDKFTALAEFGEGVSRLVEVITCLNENDYQCQLEFIEVYYGNIGAFESYIERSKFIASLNGLISIG